MASTPAPTPPMDGEDSIATLKRLREVESEGDSRIAAAKADGTERVAAAHAKMDAELTQARAEADQLHDAMVAAARREIDGEAEQILATGREEAGRVAYRSGKTLEAVRDPVLDALLEGFRSTRSSSE